MYLFSMKSWALSIVFVVFTISVISLLFPSGKLGKFIKSIFSLLLIFVTLKPIIKLKNSDVNISDVLVNNEIILQGEYLDFINNEKVSTYKKNCQKILNELGVLNAEIDFIYEMDKDNRIFFISVSLNLKNAVINSDKEHIVIIESAKQEIKDYLGLENGFEILVIYS